MKAGIRTSEFWLSVAAAFAVAYGDQVAHVAVSTPRALGLAAMAAAYTVGRSIVKAHALSAA